METSGISTRIKEVCSDYAIYKDKEAYALFAGRTLPNFVKDYILCRFTDDGSRDDQAIREYLDAKMPGSSEGLMMKLMNGEAVNITTCVFVKIELNKGQVAFHLPDLNVSADMLISPQVLQDNADEIVDGENWGNITLQYVPPKGRAKGYVMMTSFKSFNPYRNMNFEDFIGLRSKFTTEEWIDVLVASLGYTPESFPSIDSKITMLLRILPSIESNLNFIELGPKSSGKSYVYNNLSKYVRMLSGKCTRAQLVYNHNTKQYGPLKNHDVIVFDEVSSLSLEDTDKELESFLKAYLEYGSASLAKKKIESSCGMGLVGNIDLTADLIPVDDDFQRLLPDIFRSSAMIDRFHLFIPGWKLPKITEGQLYYGWAIDAEFFSEYLHYMRRQSYGHTIFDELVEYDKSAAYVRHSKAVRRVASALCKLIFPHIKSAHDLAYEDRVAFMKLYEHYCLYPAIEGRTYVYNQCKAVDREFTKSVMPAFKIDHAYALDI